MSVSTLSETQDRVWRALADPVRRALLDRLRERARTTSELCDAVDGLSRFGVMNHIAVLKEAGLVAVEKQGRERINRLVPEPLRLAHESWLDAYRRLWSDGLDRLAQTIDVGGVAEPSADAASAPPPSPVPVSEIRIDRAFDLGAGRDAVFAGLTHDIGAWWGAPYLVHPDANDVVLSPTLGGLMAEIGADGGIVLGTVEEVRAARLLVVQGSLGLARAFVARVRFRCDDLGPARTRLSFSLRAHGAFGDGQARRIDDAWRDLLDQRLRAFVETGRTSGVRAQKEEGSHAALS